MIDSPFYEASVIEQSSDGRMIALAGFEGAAIVDSLSQDIVFSLHFADIYGEAYRDCSNFGCGERRTGFSHFDISADRRVFAVSTVSGPIYIGDAEAKKIAFHFSPKSLDNKPLFIRKVKIDSANYKLYVYGAEEFSKPSTAWVLVYSLVDGVLTTAYQGGEVPGVSGGNENGSVFTGDFRYLFTADSANGLTDSRMVQPAQFRVFELE